MEVFLGDADRSGAIEAADARFVLRCAVGLEYYDAVDMLICDVDDNGYIQADDARTVLRVAVGLDDLSGATVTIDIDDTEWGDPTPGFTGYSGQYFLPDAERIANAEIVFRKLKEFGWGKNAICAVLGNLEHESTINPGIHEIGGGTGWGLAQWTPGTKYTDWAAQNGYAADSMEGQIIFLNWTMRPDCPYTARHWYCRGGYDLSYDAFIHSDAEVSYLTAAFMYNYENPNPYYSQLSKRIAYAQRWYTYFTELGQ